MSPLEGRVVCRRWAVKGNARRGGDIRGPSAGPTLFTRGSFCSHTRKRPLKTDWLGLGAHWRSYRPPNRIGHLIRRGKRVGATCSPRATRPILSSPSPALLLSQLLQYREHRKTHEWLCSAIRVESELLRSATFKMSFNVDPAHSSYLAHTQVIRLIFLETLRRHSRV